MRAIGFNQAAATGLRRLPAYRGLHRGAAGFYEGGQFFAHHAFALGSTGRPQPPHRQKAQGHHDLGIHHHLDGIGLQGHEIA